MIFSDLPAWCKTQIAKGAVSLVLKRSNIGARAKWVQVDTFAITKNKASQDRLFQAVQSLADSEALTVTVPTVLAIGAHDESGLLINDLAERVEPDAATNSPADLLSIIREQNAHLKAANAQVLEGARIAHEITATLANIVTDSVASLGALTHVAAQQAAGGLDKGAGALEPLAQVAMALMEAMKMKSENDRLERESRQVNQLEPGEK